MMVLDLADLLGQVQERGYTHNFAYESHLFVKPDAPGASADERRWIVDSRTVDTGTDPGDDATIYLIETASGQRGFLIAPYSFHTDARKAAFIDRLEKTA